MMHLFGQAAEAMTFLERVQEQSPVLAVFAAIIFVLIWMLVRQSDRSEQRLIAATERFAAVMEQSSQRNFDISEAALERSQQLSATLASLESTIRSIDERRNR